MADYYGPLMQHRPGRRGDADNTAPRNKEEFYAWIWGLNGLDGSTPAERAAEIWLFLEKDSNTKGLKKIARRYERRGLFELAAMLHDRADGKAPDEETQAKLAGIKEMMAKHPMWALNEREIALGIPWHKRTLTNDPAFD